jgi:hypothetical protein
MIAHELVDRTPPKNGGYMNIGQARRLSSGNQWFRYWIPYKFEPILKSKHKHAYLPLNRNYKPLGHRSIKDVVDYDAYPSQAVIFSSDPHLFADIWMPGDLLYLYDDTWTSRLDYFTRFERLMLHSLKVLEMTGSSS